MEDRTKELLKKCLQDARDILYTEDFVALVLLANKLFDERKNDYYEGKE